MTSIPEMQALEDIANNNLRIQELAPELDRSIPTIAPALHDSILTDVHSLGNTLALQAHMNALISNEHDRFSLLPLAEANSSNSDADGTSLWRVYRESGVALPTLDSPV